MWLLAQIPPAPTVGGDMMPLLALATGAAATVWYLWQAPKQLHLQSITDTAEKQVVLAQKRLDAEQDAHDATRKALTECKKANVDLQVELERLEAEHK